MSPDDWRALITALVVLMNALAGYLVYRSHQPPNGGQGK